MRGDLRIVRPVMGRRCEGLVGDDVDSGREDGGRQPHRRQGHRDLLFCQLPSEWLPSAFCCWGDGNGLNPNPCRSYVPRLPLSGAPGCTPETPVVRGARSARQFLVGPALDHLFERSKWP